MSPPVCDYSTCPARRSAATAAGVNLSQLHASRLRLSRDGLQLVGAGERRRESVHGLDQRQPRTSWSSRTRWGTTSASTTRTRCDCHPSSSVRPAPRPSTATSSTPWVGNAYHFNAFQKERLGWLELRRVAPDHDGHANGTYTIDPYEPRNGAKALKIAEGHDRLLLLRRAAAGASGSTRASPARDVTNGVVIHWASPFQTAASDLLDMTPATFLRGHRRCRGADLHRRGLRRLLHDRLGSGSGASVTVGLNGTPPPTCTHVAPTVGLIQLPTGSVAAGTQVPLTRSR